MLIRCERSLILASTQLCRNYRKGPFGQLWFITDYDQIIRIQRQPTVMWGGKRKKLEIVNTSWDKSDRQIQNQTCCFRFFTDIFHELDSNTPLRQVKWAVLELLISAQNDRHIVNYLAIILCDALQALLISHHTLSQHELSENFSKHQKRQT